MKRIFLFLFAFVLTTTGFAQLQLATLNHNDSITVFYGTDALVQAHDSAVNGDIIILSSGVFKGLVITKAVTVKGAGMCPDTAAGTSQTIVKDITLNIPEDSIYHFTAEGVIVQNCFFYRVYYPQFSKCIIEKIDQNYYFGEFMRNAKFLNCIIKGLSGKILNSCFVNSFVGGKYDTYSCSYYNCVAEVPNNYLDSVYAVNSILYTTSSLSLIGDRNYYNSSFSIGINTYKNYGYSYFDTNGLKAYNLHNYTNFESVFKTFRGTYSDDETFELQDSIATKILGTDGKQVGIYGGTFPFDPYVRHPYIRKCNVASKSTEDGKLSVDIEVVSEKE